jgi:hypothetical protein
MKLTLNLILFILLADLAFAQFTSLPIRLVNSSGQPLTGKASLIEFTSYPHSYPANKLSGINVTEIGSAGNYIAKGFNQFQYVKLWLEGVEQLWFDSVLTGNIFNYLASNYVTLNTQQTITGSKFTTGNWSALSTGNWLFSGSSTSNTFYKPYIINSSPWYSDFSLLPPNGLLFRLASDSLYLKREFVYYSESDNKLYFNSPGSLSTFRISKRGNSQLFDFNSQHFYWSSSNGLNLNPAIFNFDSLASNIYTNVKDTFWLNQGEPVFKYRFLTLKKLFWHNQLSFPDWKWHYSSVNEFGTAVSKDSFSVLNHADFTYDQNPFEIFADYNWNNADTVILPLRGLYALTYDLNLIFPYSSIENISARDSIIIRMINEFNTDIPVSYSEVWKDFSADVKSLPEQKSMSKTFVLFNQYPNMKFYLQIKGINNSGLIAAAVSKPSLTYILIR